MARKDDLLKQCELLGITPEKTRKRKDKDTGKTYYESSIKDFEKAIQDYYLNKYEQEGTLSPFIKNVLTLDSPMLALQIKHQKPEIQDLIWQDNNNWVFQEKIDGTRCLLCYDKNYGYDFYSRNKSVTDCLPISYKTKLLIPKIIQEVLDRYNINSFIIDTELVPLNKQINTMKDGTELVADTQLSLVTSILGSLDDLSHKMQETNPLKFIAFDLIMLNGNWLTDLPLEKRDKSLNGIIQILKVAGMNNRIEKVQSTLNNKHQFYDTILSMGGEGVVAKDLTSKYDLLGKRAGEWCFRGNMLVTLEDGSQKSIKEIVDNKLKCNVLSYNFKTNKIESKPIIGWYNNGIKERDNWIKLRVFNKRDGHSLKSNGLDYSSIECTKNHKLFNSLGNEVNANDIQINDTILAYHYNLSYEQQQIILGMILGDGCLHKNKDDIYSISWCQSIDVHSDYFNYINNCLGINICLISDGISGFGSNIKTLHFRKTKPIQDYLSKYYLKNSPAQCNLVKVLDDLDDIGVAHWIMDDGGSDTWGHRIGIATCTFNIEQLDIIKNWFIQKYNLNEADINITNRKCIVFKDDAFKTIANIVGKYIHPSIRYKFGDLKNILEPFIDLSVNITNYSVQELPVVIKKNFSDIKKRGLDFTAYDIEVEDNNNYFVNNILAHNCKIKRTISQSIMMEKIGDTVDAFITGFKEGNIGTSNEGLIGALEFSVYLTDDENNYLYDEEGNPILHHIATVSGISQELRILLSNKDNQGNIILNSSFYGKVATIDGQDISSKNMRFAHATFKGWRPDRDAMSCKMQKSFLERMVM